MVLVYTLDMGRHTHFLSPLLKSSAGTLALFAENRIVATNLEAAFDSRTRKRGLLGRPGIGPADALIIAPCNGVHTFRMQFPIDIIYATRAGRVVKLRSNVVPGRISVSIQAFATIEMAAGSIQRAELEVGDILCVREAST